MFINYSISKRLLPDSNHIFSKMKVVKSSSMKQRRKLDCHTFKFKMIKAQSFMKIENK